MGWEANHTEPRKPLRVETGWERLGQESGEGQQWLKGLQVLQWFGGVERKAAELRTKGGAASSVSVCWALATAKVGAGLGRVWGWAE